MLSQSKRARPFDASTHFGLDILRGERILLLRAPSFRHLSPPFPASPNLSSCSRTKPPTCCFQPAPPGLVGAAEPSPTLRFAVRCCHLLLPAKKNVFFPLQDGCIQHPQSPLAQRRGVAQLQVLPKSLLQIPCCGRTGKGPQQTGRAAPPFPAEFPQKMISLALN